MKTPKKYKYNSGDISFQPTSITGKVLKFIAFAAMTALGLLIVIYLLFAIFGNTDVESRLRRENKMYEKLYSQVDSQSSLIGDAVAHLESKDNRIYRDIFHSPAPNIDPINSLPFLFGSDTIPSSKIVSYSNEKAERLFKETAAIEENFRSVLGRLASGGVIPPMELPLRNISFTQVGASVGERMNPFLKAKVGHSGIDFIVHQGTPVYAPADGTVLRLEKSSKGMGNVISISHPGGYVTRYAHLSTFSVKEGQKVKKGARIGTVGSSGTAYAPHLHYEIMLDGEYVDPINYIFASVTPEEYANMLYMAVNTEQTLD